MPSTPASYAGDSIAFDVARTLAAQENYREKVLAYITRGDHELLVFEHTPNYPDAGIQVPAGGTDTGETPEQAVSREVSEETGLRLSHPVHLASFFWSRGVVPSRVRHFCWFQAPESTPDEWTHVVSGGENDQGMTFLFRFAPLEQPDLIAGYGYEAALPQLRELLKEKNA